MNDIADIKRRAGITEFAAPEHSENDDFSSRHPLSYRLESIARSAQRTGRIDQHQIEEIFRGAKALKEIGQ